MNQPLQGLRILNTRPGEPGRLLGEAIQAAGGVNLAFPVLSIEWTAPEWQEHLPDLSTLQIALFTSVHAVDSCFAHLQKPWPASIAVFAIGQATAKALQKKGVPRIQTPKKADSEHLLALPALQDIKGQSVALFKGEGGLNCIENTLRERQADLHILTVYRRKRIELDPALSAAVWQNDAADIILITSEEILDNLVRLFPNTWLCKKTCLLVSLRLIEKARNIGITHILASTPETILETLITYSRTLHDRR